MQYLSYTVAYINFYKEALKFLHQATKRSKFMDRALVCKQCLIALQMRRSAGIPVYVSSYTSGQSVPTLSIEYNDGIVMLM